MSTATLDAAKPPPSADPSPGPEPEPTPFPASPSGTADVCEMREAAFGYARRGWRVFPVHTVRKGRCSCGRPDCRDPGKHPRTRHGLTDASAEVAVVQSWWMKWPDANLGVATGGGFFALDVDPRHAGDESLHALEAQHGELPATVESLTGGGGRHLLFLSPKGQTVRNATGLAGWPGLDIRGDGGYIVAPPSCHESGRDYAWEAAHHPDDVDLVEAPSWLWGLFSKNGGKAKGADPIGDRILSGSRNSTLASLAGTMRRRGASEASILAALLAENEERCVPPLDEAEVQEIAASIASYAPAPPPDTPPPLGDADAPPVRGGHAVGGEAVAAAAGGQAAHSPGQPDEGSVGARAVPRQSGSVREDIGRRRYIKSVKDGKDWADTELSSFLVVPRMRISTDDGEALRADVLTATGRRFEDVLFHQDSWHSKRQFLKALPSLDLTWYGSDIDLQRLQAIVATYDVPRKRGVRVAGVRDGVFVTPQGVIGPDGWLPDHPFVYLPRDNTVNDRFEFTWCDDAQYASLREALREHLPTAYDPSVSLVLIGWHFAVPSKPHFMALPGVHAFPLLDVYGPHGSGKTTLTRLHWRLAGAAKTEPLTPRDTPFALLTSFSATNALPLVIDEYKNDLALHSRREFLRYVRDAYQGATHERGLPSLEKVRYVIQTPIVVAGEELLGVAEPAIMERIVPAATSRGFLEGEHSEAARRSLAPLESLPLHHFAARYLSQVLRWDQDAFQPTVEAARADAIRFGCGSESHRVLNNVTVVLFGLRRFEQATGWDYEAHQAQVEETVGGILHTVGKGSAYNRLAIEIALSRMGEMAATRRIEAGVHYVTNEDDDGRGGPTLCLRLAECVAELRKYSRETDWSGEVQSCDAYKRQIAEIAKKSDSWVVANRIRVYFGQSRVRCPKISVNKAMAAGIDLCGFGFDAEDHDGGAQ